MARSWDTTEYTTNEWRSWRVSGATPAQVEAIVVGRMMMMMMMMNDDEDDADDDDDDDELVSSLVSWLAS